MAATKEQRALADECRKKLKADPSLTVDRLAQETGADYDEVWKVLDSFSVDGTDVVHKGPGQGGGWLTP